MNDISQFSSLFCANSLQILIFDLSCSINKDEKILGIITPTYFWRLPRIVTEFLEKLTIENCKYTFLLASYGTSTGQPVAMAREILKRKGQKFDAYYSVIMPDTWTPIFNLTIKRG